MKDNQVTILLTTCDKYEDAWYPFFYFWKKYWPDCSYPFVLNTESKDFYYDGFSITSIHGGTNISWSKRLKNCLAQIQTEYVLLCLEDYFLQKPVKKEIFQKALKTMKETPDLGVIQFAIDMSTKYDREIKINEYFSPVPKYEKSDINGRIFCVLSLYRTQYLKKLLLSTESPWQFECFGSLRSQFYREKVYRENESHERCFYYFLQPKYGYGILRGKWLPNNSELFEENNLCVNFSNLGIMEGEEYKERVKRYSSKSENKNRHQHTLFQKVIMPFTHPIEFLSIIRNIVIKGCHKVIFKCKLIFPFLP